MFRYYQTPISEAYFSQLLPSSNTTTPTDGVYSFFKVLGLGYFLLFLALAFLSFGGSWAPPFNLANENKILPTEYKIFRRKCLIWLTGNQLMVARYNVTIDLWDPDKIPATFLLTWISNIPTAFTIYIVFLKTKVDFTGIIAMVFFLLQNLRRLKDSNNLS